MAKEQKNMTLEEALELLKGDILDLSRSKSASVMAIVRAADPNHPLLKKAEERIEAFNKAEQDAILYQKNLRSVDAVASQADYSAFISDPENKDDIAVLVEYTKIEDEHGNVLDDEKKTEHFKRLYYGARDKAAISLVNDSTAAGQDLSKVNKAEVQKNLQSQTKTIFYGDFAAIVAARQLPKPKGKERVLGTTEYFNFIGKQAQKATEVFQNLLTKKGEIRVKSDHFIASAVDSVEQVNACLENVRSKLHSKVVQCSEKAKAAYTEAATYWQKQKTHLETKAKKLWGNRYVLFNSIKNSFKDNKLKMIGDISVSFGTAMWASIGAASAAAAGVAVAPVVTAATATYAAYHMVGAWIWPVVAEMRKINRERKENKHSKLSFKQQLDLALRHKIEDKNQRRSYLISAALNTVAAFAIPAVVNHFAQTIDASRDLGQTVGTGINASLAAKTASVRRLAYVGHAATIVAAGGVDTSVDAALARLEKDETQKSLLKASAKRKALSTLFTTAASAAGVWLGFKMGEHTANAQETAIQAVSGEHGASNTLEGVLPRHMGASLENADSLLNRGQPDSLGMNAFARDSIQGIDSTRVAPLDTMRVDTVVQQPDSLVQTTPVEDFAQVSVDAGNGNESTFVFPTEWNKDMGISQKQFEILVKTTEGTLSGDNQNITLDRAYMNAETLAESLGKTKEQVLWDTNRLYAFMRKAIPVGNGTFREAPSGAEYLTERFGKMNLGLDENAMRDLVSFAKEHTYDGKADILAGLKETYGEQFNGAQLNKMASIITSNQRFYQHGEEMEALLKALGCGDEISSEELKKVGALLSHTNEILKTGGKNVALTGFNLEDCPQDQGEWREVAQAIKQVAEEAKEEVTDTPVVQQPIMIVPEETVETPVEAPVTPEPVAEPDLRGVEKAVIDNWKAMTGQEDPLYQKHLFDTPVKEPVQLETVPSGDNEAIRSVSENAAAGRTIEKVSVHNFKQMTGQENPDAVKATYQVASHSDETAKPIAQAHLEDDSASAVKEVTRSGARPRRLERGSASTTAQLFGRKGLDR